MRSTRRRSKRWLAILGIAVLLPACAGDASDDPGIASLPTVTAELDMRVGSVDDPDETLTFIRDLAVHPSGRIYTLHRSEHVVRIIGPDGSIERVVGGEGDGPGEFQGASSMGWVADTLWVLDTSSYRFSLFLPDGTFHRSFSVPFATAGGQDEVQPPRARGLLSDGTVWGSPPAFSHQVQAGVFTHHDIMRLEPDGSVIDSVARIPVGRNMWGISDPDDPGGGGMYLSQPFADGPLWEFGPDSRSIFVLDRGVEDATGRAPFVLSKLSLGGDTAFSRRYVVDGVPVRDAEVDSLLEAQVEALGQSAFFGDLAPGTARRWAEHDLYRPQVRPAVTDMVVGRTGEVWLKETVEPGAEATWLRVSAEGEPLQRVALPDGLQLLEADEDRLWGQETDDIDVPYVVRYRLPSP